MRSWTTHTLSEILPEEFYSLIDRNREHIARGFPVTVANTMSLGATLAASEQSAINEEKDENYYRYLRDTKTNALIGYVLVKNIDRKINKCELAYFVDKDFQGKGIITTSVANLITFCFGELGMGKITICTALDNYGSQRIAFKQGFTQEGILRREFKNGNGELEDLIYYGLLKTEYDKK
ncbi:GNAT family N-acetyltransferase [Flavobacterium sp.]|uniref:GNAT family N-acetyltransferase n=1 Tax=Flavobacterium sp. TaxID=239 RepID=UPI0040332374